MLNHRNQKGKFWYRKFLRVWNYYVKQPHLTTDIWNWKPTMVWRVVCGKVAHTVLWGAVGYSFMWNFMKGVSRPSSRRLIDNMHERWIDIGKSFAIFAVLTDHLCGTLYTRSSIIYSSFFSVSLFILLMGVTTYWTFDKKNETIWKEI